MLPPTSDPAQHFGVLVGSQCLASLFYYPRVRRHSLSQSEEGPGVKTGLKPYPQSLLHQLLVKIIIIIIKIVIN